MFCIGPLHSFEAFENRDHSGSVGLGSARLVLTRLMNKPGMGETRKTMAIGGQYASGKFEGFLHAFIKNLLEA